MKAGARRHKLTIVQNTPTRSNSGQDVDSWGTYKTVWADLRPADGRERRDSSQVHAEADYLASYPYLDAPGTTPAMRVTYGSRTFDILAAPIDNKRREILLSLRERNL